MELNSSDLRCIWGCAGDEEVGLLIWTWLDGVERGFEALEILVGNCGVGAFG